MSATPQAIRIRGARTHNLKGINVDIPKGRLTVICGPSGSGKTSLAFDTLYIEGQRRYIESLSARIRQHFEELPRPDVESIANLSPTVAVGGNVSPRLAKGTLATLTEIYDYLKLLFSHAGEIFCETCNRVVRAWDGDSISAALGAPVFSGRRAMIGFAWEAPLGESGRVRRDDALMHLLANGWSRVLVGHRLVTIQELFDEPGQPRGETLPEEGPSESEGHGMAGPIFVIVDRLKLGSAGTSRLRDSIEAALRENPRACVVFLEVCGNKSADTTEQGTRITLDDNPEKIVPGVLWRPWDIDGETWLWAAFSTEPVCPGCGARYIRPHPNLFNYHTPEGACPRCLGAGKVWSLNKSALFPNLRLSLEKGAIAPFRGPQMARFQEKVLEFAKEVGIPTKQPVGKLPPETLDRLLHGVPGSAFPGIEGIFRELERYRNRPGFRAWWSRWHVERVCPECRGARLRRESLAIVLRGGAETGNSRSQTEDPHGTGAAVEGPPPQANIQQLCSATVTRARDFLRSLTVNDAAASHVRFFFEAILNRLDCLISLGLGYLTLDRPADTLSTGEFRRALLGAVLGSSLRNIIYVLDEPSSGLHPRDRQALCDITCRLRDRGNTVVVVEHDEILLRSADWVIELGPGAGERGGEIVFCGTPRELEKSETLTGEYLSRRRCLSLARARRQPAGWIKLVGATGHNLKNLTVEFPLGVLCVVTGVSGAGKSSLVEKTLYPALCRRLYGKGPEPLPFSDLLGEKQIGDVVLVDQSPPARTPRSNAATFIKALDEIRRVFAATSEAKIRGYRVSHFSFNSPEGRCPRCEGEGVLEVDMVFLPNIELPCPECRGSRYRPEVLTVAFRGKSIAEILQMTVREAYFFFRGEPRVQARLRRLMDVGLDYIRLGQPLKTLSGGELQRLQLAAHFTQSRKRPSLFILNEPTSGLHPHDVRQLIECFETLLSYGHSLLVIEHNLHLVAAADYVIDLGPEAGEKGGTVVAQGLPEEIARCPVSITGQFLRRILGATGNSHARARSH